MIVQTEWLSSTIFIMMVLDGCHLGFTLYYYIRQYSFVDQNIICLKNETFGETEVEMPGKFI